MGAADSCRGWGHQQCTPAVPGLGFLGWERGGGDEAKCCGGKA